MDFGTSADFQIFNNQKVKFLFCHFTKVAPRNPRLAEVLWLQTKHSLEFTVIHSKNKKSIALHFSNGIPNDVYDYLKELGFREYSTAPLKLFAKDCLSYRQFIKEFQEAIENDMPWNNIIIHPSYESTQDNIEDDNFSKIQFIFTDADKKDEEYVVFEPLKGLATKIAQQYGEIHFKNALKAIVVYPRKFKADSRNLFKQGKILYSADSYHFDAHKEKEITPKEIAIEEQEEIPPLTTELEKKDQTFRQETQDKEAKEIIPVKSESELEPEKEDNTLNKKNTEEETKEQELITPKKKKQTHWEYEIPFAKKLKYTAKISIAQLENDSYAYGLSYQKNYGDFSGYSGSPSEYDPQFPSRKKALKAGFTLLVKQIEATIENGDAILNNDPLHRKRMRAVLKSVEAFAIKKGIDLPKSIVKNPVDKTPAKIKTPLEKQAPSKVAPIIEVSRLDREYAQKREANGYATVQSVIQKLQVAIDDLEQDKEITQLLINGLLDAIDSDNLTEDVKQVVNEFRAHYNGLTDEAITFEVLRLITFFRLSELKANPHFPKIRSIEEETLENMLIPERIGKHFAYGDISFSKRALYKKEYPYLYYISDDTLESTPSVSLFKLLQFPHPTDYDISVTRPRLHHFLENHGEMIFKELGLPTDANYPYINLHTHHRDIRPLGEIISSTSDRKQWWYAIENYRPIKDVGFGITLIDEQITIEQQKQEGLINLSTGKPKSSSLDSYRNIGWNVRLLEQSKANIQTYIESLPDKDQSQIQAGIEATPYLDQVVAIMHTHYHKGERLSKKKIEALLDTTSVPTLGMLWEAVELSWLLWYRQLYLQITPFEDSLKAMIRFWNSVQPTYAYSDSSKEKYKQYSTPCLIGAMLAEYTGMRSAEAVFEPSAGNGLLLVGAKPHKTIVNEIDTSRLASLRFQRFSEVHALNASEPFPQKWKHHFDVMVTNPPFARWEADRFDKKRLVAKYFNQHYELASYMRLEHLMAGLALDTLKDTGKSGIIIMGHFVYGNDGHIGRYAPFFKWLYRHYIVDDVINLNGFTLYNKQGAVARMMLILVGGRKHTPSVNFPTKQTHPQLEAIIDSYPDLWLRIKSHMNPLKKLVEQLKIANR